MDAARQARVDKALEEAQYRTAVQAYERETARNVARGGGPTNRRHPHPDMLTVPEGPGVMQKLADLISEGISYGPPDAYDRRIAALFTGTTMPGEIRGSPSEGRGIGAGDFVPGVGSGMALGDAWDAFKRGNYGEALLNVGSAVPEIGPAAKAMFLAAGRIPGKRRAIRALTKQGLSEDEIYRQTASIQRHGNWMTEIPDRQATFTLPGMVNNKALTGKLSDYMQNQELFDLMPGDPLKGEPALADTPVEFVSFSQKYGPDNEFGGYHYPMDPSSPGKLEINTDRPIDDQKSVLLHEVQHRVSQIENFPRGGNPSDPSLVSLEMANRSHATNRWSETGKERADFVAAQMDRDYDIRQDEEFLPGFRPKMQDYRTYWNRQNPEQAKIIERYGDFAFDTRPPGYAGYMNTADEVLARNVQKRADMTRSELFRNPPGMTEEVPEDLQIVRNRSSMAPSASDARDQLVGLLSDEQGKPRTFYRGEHGEPPPGGGFQTKLPSLSFGSQKAANTYAMTPNSRYDTAVAPRVTPAHLRIQNPVFNNPDDPFIDFSELIPKVGEDEVRRLAIEHAGVIQNTNNWEENFAPQYDSVEELLAAEPQRLSELYMDAFEVLNDPEFINVAKAKGYDGAIHMGNGETFDEQEYRIFDASQAVSPYEKRDELTGTMMPEGGGGRAPGIKHDISNLVLDKPPEEMKATYEETTPLLPPKPFSPDQMKVGDQAIAIPGDRTTGGKNLLSVEGQELTKPQKMQGGEAFTRGEEQQKYGAGWANEPPVASAVENVMAKSKGDNWLWFLPMSYKALDASRQMSGPMVDLFRQAEPSRKALEQFIPALQKGIIDEGGKDIVPALGGRQRLADWLAGFADWANSADTSMKGRGAISKTLDTRAMKNLTGVDVAPLRVALTDPNLMNVEPLSAGYSVLKANPEGGRLIRDPEIKHPDYGTQFRADYMGRTENLFPYSDLFRTFTEERNALKPGEPESNRAFTFRKGVQSQEITQELIDWLMQIQEQAAARGGRR